MPLAAAGPEAQLQRVSETVRIVPARRALSCAEPMAHHFYWDVEGGTRDLVQAAFSFDGLS
jgi:hypothetical protein